MRILCTGSAGFIGKHLSKKSAELGRDFFGFDLKYPAGAQSECFGGDIRHADVLARAFDRYRPDVVIHGAALASVRESMKQPMDYITTNIVGTYHVLAECLRRSIPLVNISSGGTVYGEPCQLPVPIDHFCEPKDVYGASKLAAEYLVRALGDAKELRHWNLRYPNVYGPGQDPYGEAGVVAIFTRAMLDKKPVTIYNNGLQTRDFMYVDDVVTMTFEAMQRASGTYNIGTGVATDVLTIFDILAKLTDYKLEPKHGPKRMGEVTRMSLQPGWKRTNVSLEEGLRRTVDWFRKRS